MKLFRTVIPLVSYCNVWSSEEWLLSIDQKTDTSEDEEGGNVWLIEREVVYTGKKLSIVPQGGS